MEATKIKEIKHLKSFIILNAEENVYDETVIHSCHRLTIHRTTIYQSEVQSRYCNEEFILSIVQDNSEVGNIIVMSDNKKIRCIYLLFRREYDSFIVKCVFNHTVLHFLKGYKDYKFEKMINEYLFPL